MQINRDCGNEIVGGEDARERQFLGLQFRSPEREVLRLLIFVHPTGRTGTQFASAGG